MNNRSHHTPNPPKTGSPKRRTDTTAKQNKSSEVGSHAGTKSRTISGFFYCCFCYGCQKNASKLLKHVRLAKSYEKDISSAELPS